MDASTVPFRDLLPGHVFMFHDPLLATQVGLCVKVQQDAIPISGVARIVVDLDALVRIVPLNQAPALAGSSADIHRQRSVMQYMAKWWVYDQLITNLLIGVSDQLSWLRGQRAQLLQQTLDQLSALRLVSPVSTLVIEAGYPIQHKPAYRITGLGLLWAINEGVIDLLE